MRFPKTIVISGREYKVIIDKKYEGGEWTYHPPIIRVGSKGANSELMMQIFLHEIIEGMLATKNYRYLSYPTDFLFVFNHLQFISFVEDLYLAIKPILKQDKAHGKKKSA